MTADNLSKGGWICGCVSTIDTKDERSGLQTHIATENVSLSAGLKADRFSGIGESGLSPPIERTMLTTIASDGVKRFVVRGEGLLTAFILLESGIRAFGK